MLISIKGIGDQYPLHSLKVMQADLRHWDHMDEMISFVKKGGFWTQEYLEQYSKEQNLSRVSPIISISRFEDGWDFLHDGHHRCVATWLAGRDYLRSDEFVLTNWVYEDYLEIAPHNNWYTPFHPKTHVRTADFAEFKAKAKERFAKDPHAAVDWVYEHFDEFRTERLIETVPELASLIKQKMLLAH